MKLYHATYEDLVVHQMNLRSIDKIPYVEIWRSYERD